MDKKKIMKLRIGAQRLKPTVHVGKEGLTEKVIKELKMQLEKNKLVKIRMLDSIEGDRKELAETIARDTSSTVVDVRGFTVVLARD